jgi:hypothetical protein
MIALLWRSAMCSHCCSQKKAKKKIVFRKRMKKGYSILNPKVAIQKEPGC